MRQVVTEEWATQQACHLIERAWMAFVDGQYVAAYGWANRADYVARLAAGIDTQVRVMRVYCAIAGRVYAQGW